jgi:twitching motility protein PilT
MDIATLLQIVVDRSASDLHLSVGRSPTIRVDGRLETLEYPPLTPEDTERLMKSITPQIHQKRLEISRGSDFCFAYGDIARFRTSVFWQKGVVGLSLRLLPNRMLGFEEIGLPLTIKDLLDKPRGLVLVTGPTGSGKTTTLASMINYINEQRDCHIITIEDPIEYFHVHKKSIITQRELEVDVPDFAEAIKRGLRQDPDVILVGEMRDLATMEAAIIAAETGHLVFATLHTSGAARTIDRIIDVFPISQQEQIRTQLSVSILAVISQQLLPHLSGRGRVAAFEIMIATPAIQNLIREKKTYRITSFIQTGTKYGMKTMDQSLLEYYQRKMISYEELINSCYDVEEVQAKLKTP